MGEFGAVAVVSGKIRGVTDTMPLYIEALSQEDFTASFAVASVLAVLALVTLVVKSLVEWQVSRQLAARDLPGRGRGGGGVVSGGGSRQEAINSQRSAVSQAFADS